MKYSIFMGSKQLTKSKDNQYLFLWVIIFRSIFSYFWAFWPHLTLRYCNAPPQNKIKLNKIKIINNFLPLWIRSVIIVELSHPCSRLLCQLVLTLLCLQNRLWLWRVFLSPPAGHGVFGFSDVALPNMHSTCVHVHESCSASPLQNPGEKKTPTKNKNFIECVSLFMAVTFMLCVSDQGDMCGDCVYTTFCNICSWCQMAREIKRHKQSMTFITTQAVYTGDQQFLVTQPGVVASQPVMATAPQAILTSM